MERGAAEKGTGTAPRTRGVQPSITLGSRVSSSGDAPRCRCPPRAHSALACPRRGRPGSCRASTSGLTATFGGGPRDPAAGDPVCEPTTDRAPRAGRPRGGLSRRHRGRRPGRRVVDGVDAVPGGQYPPPSGSGRGVGGASTGRGDVSHRVLRGRMPPRGSPERGGLSWGLTGVTRKPPGSFAFHPALLDTADGRAHRAAPGGSSVPRCGHLCPGWPRPPRVTPPLSSRVPAHGQGRESSPAVVGRR